MSAREELAQSIAANFDRMFGKCEFGPATQDYELADALLAGGWGKRRTVATVEELVTLPGWSVIRSDEGAVFEKQNSSWWHESGSRDLMHYSGIALPAIVIYEPQS